MILYHGSKDIIERPIYGFGKKYNDYGKGFYCTEDITLAKEWAVGAERNGYANEYSFDGKGLKVLDLSSDEYTVLNWLAILVDNRLFDIQSDFGEAAREYLRDRFLPKYETYDVIKGYRADDSYFTFAQDFLNNQISLKTLNAAMHLGKLGMQYVIKSDAAFKKIEFVNAHEALFEEWYPRKEKRDRDARTAYAKLRKQPWQRGEIYIMRILDEEMEADDERLRL